MKVDGGYDADGNPVAPTETTSEKIPCNLLQVLKQVFFYNIEGRQVEGRYTVYVQNSGIINQAIIDGLHNAKLYTLSGVLLGTFEVLPVHELAMMGTCKLILV